MSKLHTFEIPIYLEADIEDYRTKTLYVRGNIFGNYRRATYWEPEEFPELEWWVVDGVGQEVEYEDLESLYPYHIIPSVDEIEKQCWDGVEDDRW